MSLTVPLSFAASRDGAAVDEVPEIAGPWSDLDAESSGLTGAATALGRLVDETAGVWAQLRGQYDEPSTAAVVHRAMDAVVPRAEHWTAAMTAAGAALEDFAQQARMLQARAEALRAARGAVLLAAAQIEAADSRAETWWDRLRVADYNADVAALRDAWEQLQQDFCERLEGIERARGFAGEGSPDAADAAAGAVADAGVFSGVETSGAASAAGSAAGSASGADARAGAGASGTGADPEELVEELQGLEDEEIVEHLREEGAEERAAALTERRLAEDFTLPGSPARRMREVIAAHDDSTAEGMAAIREEFLSLDEEARRRLVLSHPSEFGNLNGIPFRLRALAHAVRTVGLQHRVRQQLDETPAVDEDLRDRVQETGGGSGYGYDPGESVQEAAARQEEIDRLETLQAGLEQAEEQITQGAGRRSVVQLTTRGRGEAVVMDGTPSASTERTLTHVPGTGTDLSSLRNQMDRVERLAGDGDPEERVSVYWQGAQMPPDLVDNVDGMSPAFDLEAEVERGARSLAAFDMALDLEVPEGATTTVSAHSAGTGYMGRAAHRDYGLTADHLVYVAPAGPGKGILSNEDFADPSTTVFMVEARDDAVDPAREMLGWDGVHGRAPQPWDDPMDSLERIDLEPGAADRTVLEEGELPELVSDAGPFASHSDVLGADTHAVESIRAVVAGDDHRVLPLYRPGDPRLPGDAEDHEAAVRRRLLEDHEEREDWVSMEELVTTHG